MSAHYILNGRNAVPCDATTWARWYESAACSVQQTERDGVRVSTIFLGLNHQCGPGPPMLFETMIFGGEHDRYQERCTTWKEAEAMHATAEKLAGLT